MSTLPAAAPAAPPAPKATDPEVTRVFLVRHAERHVTPGDSDPPLTPAGRRRAALLGRMLRTADVAAVFSTQFLRARATAESVSVATGAPVEVFHSDSSMALAHRIQQHYHGTNVVVIGHSDSLPNVLSELGWYSENATRPWSYEDFGLLELRHGERPHLLLLHYGGPGDTTGMSLPPR